MFNVQSRKVNPQSLEKQLEQLTCIYRNESEFIQIIRISQPNISFFERSVFPNQCVQFSAPRDTLLEIHEAAISGSIHADTIPCSQIAILNTDMGRNLSVVKDSCKDLLVAMAA
jgi:hypothetical protein